MCPRCRPQGAAADPGALIMRAAGRIIRTDVDDDALAYDPLSDLLFTMVAILLLAFMAVLPGLALTVVTQPAPPAPPSSLTERNYSFEGRSIAPYLATGAGLRRIGDPRVVPADAILDDAGLRATLTELATRAEPVFIFIAADGLEVAFEFEAVASAAGIRTFRQIRLATDCKPQRPSIACGFDIRGGAK